MPIVLFIAAAAVVVFVGVKLAQAAARRERQRVAALQGWALANGLVYSQQGAFDLDQRYNGTVGEIGRGHSRYAYDVLRAAAPVETFLFRYHYQTTETRTVTHTDSQGHTSSRTESYEESHERAYLVCEMGAAFPSFVLRPEHWGDKIAGLLGFEDINFESEQFSRRYFCKSADRQFAYALIHPKMMEWLMDRKFSCHLDNGRFVMELSAQPFTADTCNRAWSAAAGFINQIPEFVWQDYAKRAKIELRAPIEYEIAAEDNRTPTAS